MKRWRGMVNLAAVLLLLTSQCQAAGQTQARTPDMPWTNTSLTPDQRADLLLQRLTLEQKVQLLHGTGDPHIGAPDPHAAEGNGGSGYVPGFPEYGIPGIQMDDSAYGVAYSGGSGRYSTALPSNLGLAATWDTETAETYGALIGRELRDQGYNMSLGGGVNLTRDPRNGRTFEYQGEDPLLAGTMVGHLIRGVQSTHVLGDIKHFAVNDQESGRHAVSSEIDERAMRETDLLAFQIGIATGDPGAVMCAYNRVNGTYACENSFLLHDVLKHEWKYPGFVVSDWLATHSTEQASRAGLDQEEPGNTFLGPALLEAVRSGKVPLAEVNEHAHRVLRSMFASGVVDDPAKKQVPDVFRGASIARSVARSAIVLLRNQGRVLPIDSKRVHTVVVIGRNADRGMISGGGSAQVDPPQGNAIGDIPEKLRTQDWQKAVWFPDAPVAAIKAALPNAAVQFDSGADPEKAAAMARGADLVLVYAYQWQAEGVDLPTLALPDGQDRLITEVAKANASTVVVLETGGPVLMPWITKVAAVVESWYSGTVGASAVADVLVGDVNPSGKLPVTFPLADSDLPHPKLVQPPPASQEDWTDSDAMSRRLLAGLPSFPTKYDEGLKVGYKWYDAEHKPVLFPFGFGLSYTSFTYSKLVVDAGSETVNVRFDVKNTGGRGGSETAEVYATMPASSGEPPKRLVGWVSLSAQPGETRHASLTLPRTRFAVWDRSRHAWSIVAGNYDVLVGPDSGTFPLHQSMTLR